MTGTDPDTLLRQLARTRRFSLGHPAPATVPRSIAEAPAMEPRADILPLGPRELRAALFLPSWHHAGDGPLPVLRAPYGGPALRKVTAAPG